MMGRRATWPMFADSFGVAEPLRSRRAPGGKVSGRKNSTARKAPKANTAAASAVRSKLASATLSPARNPPIAGPAAKPRLNAAEILPMAPARSSGPVTSDTHANAVAMLADVVPLSRRDIISIVSESAKPSSKYAPTCPAQLISRIGRRPKRSLRSPQTGVARDWHNGWIARISVICSGPAPRRST